MEVKAASCLPAASSLPPAFVELHVARRQALLMELAAVEDFLIGQGRLRRRSVVSRAERKGAGRGLDLDSQEE